MRFIDQYASVHAPRYKLTPAAVNHRPFHRRLHQWWRDLLGRDYCERCSGVDGVPGNENVVQGVVMCDFCSVRYYKTLCCHIEDDTH